MRIDVAFGLMAPPLSEQVGHLIADPKTMEHLEKDAEAISRLYVRGVMTESESKRARDRLFKDIVKAINANPAASPISASSGQAACCAAEQEGGA